MLDPDQALEATRAAIAANPFEDDALGGAYISGYKDAHRRKHEDLVVAEQELNQREAEILRLDGELGRAQAAYDALKAAASVLP